MEQESRLCGIVAKMRNSSIENHEYWNEPVKHFAEAESHDSALEVDSDIHDEI